jgi:hypothetical protein
MTVFLRSPAMTSQYTVERYRLRFTSGHSKWATQVTAPDGRVVRFVDLCPKRIAIPQAIAELAKAAR